MIVEKGNSMNDALAQHFDLLSTNSTPEDEAFAWQIRGNCVLLGHSYWHPILLFHMKLNT